MNKKKSLSCFLFIKLIFFRSKDFVTFFVGGEVPVILPKNPYQTLSRLGGVKMMYINSKEYRIFNEANQ